jgi:membrane fusion protein (multidrug efflux system)
MRPQYTDQWPWPGLRLWLSVGTVLVSITISGCSSRADAERVPPPPTVGVVEARRMTVPILAEPIGTTRALQEVSIRARVRGFLQTVHFVEGADVKAGQLLFVIDEEPFKAKLAQANAKLEAAEASVKKAKDSKAREVATAQLALDQALLALYQVEARRQGILVQRNSASQEDLDRSVAMRKKGEAQVDADKASLEQSKSDHETNILSATADVAAAKAAVDDAKIELSYCRMSSPIDGRVGLAQIKVGNLVGPATSVGGADFTELAIVRQLDPMGVDIAVSSRYLERAAKLIEQGFAVDVYRPGLEGEEDRRYPGKAMVIDNAINPTTSTFLIRAEIANPAKALLPGEYVKATAKVGEVKDVVVVPEQAVVETQAGQTVYTVDAKGKVAVITVRATFTYQGLRVLESGLQPGTSVIVEGLQLVRNGMVVKPEPAKPDSQSAPPDKAEPKGTSDSTPAAPRSEPKP